MNKRLGSLLLLILGLVGWIAWRMSSPTDAARVDVQANDASIEARSDQAIVAPKPAERTQITLSAAKSTGRARLIVRCVDQLTGEAVKGVDIEVKPRIDPATQPDDSAARVQSSRGVAWIQGEEDLDVPAGIPLDVFGRSRTRAFEEAFQVVEALEPGARHEITLEIALPAKPVMHVRVVDQETGIGVAKARLERSYFEKPDLESDASGRAVLHFVKQEWGSRSTSRENPLPQGFCRVHAQGYGTAEFRESTGHERDDLALEIRLSRAASLVASLLNQPDIRAQAYNLTATVSVATLEQNASTTTLEYDYGELRFRSISDVDGRMRIDGLPANVPVELLLSHGSEPLRRQQAQLLPGEERALTIDLGNPCHLRGRIVDSSGAGAADLEVWLKPGTSRISFGESGDCVAKVRSDASGNFDMSQVRVGSFWLVLAPIRSTQQDKENSIGTASSPLALEILPGETEKDVELRIARGLFIRGKVVRSDGSATNVGGVDVNASSKQRHGARAKTLFDGTFIVGPLMEVSYTLSVLEDDSFGGSLPVEVVAGATDVVIVLLEGASLSGRVVESAGGPGVRAMVLRTYLDGLGTTSRGNTDAKGAFRYTMLRPTRMSLTAYTTDGRIAVLPSLPLSSGENRDLEVLLSPGAKLRFKATNGATFSIVHVFQEEVLVAWPDFDTVSTASTIVPVGNLIVRVHLDGKPIEKNVTVSAGEEREVEFP